MVNNNTVAVVQAFFRSTIVNDLSVDEKGRLRLFQKNGMGIQASGGGESLSK